MGLNIWPIVTQLSIFLTILFWPLNFMLNNSLKDTLHFFLPSLLITAGIMAGERTFLSKITICLIPFLNHSLLFAPLTALIPKRNTITIIIFIVVIIIIIFWAFKPFLGSSVLYYSRDDQQKVVRQGYLYPNIYLSRLFQNKPAIYINRFLYNFFALIDPNNYFFAFHPQEIKVENQNLQKFPFLAIIFFLTGLYYAALNKRWLLLTILILILNLSLLKNFDKTDAILWLPLSFLMIIGVFKFLEHPGKIKAAFFVLFLIFSLVEYLHLIINSAVNI